MKPHDYDYIEKLPAREKELQYKKMLRFCPVEVTKWNQKFMGVISDFVNNKTPYNDASAAAIVEIWQKRKKIEAATNCHAFWVFSQPYFVETFQALNWDFGELINKLINDIGDFKKGY